MKIQFSKYQGTGNDFIFIDDVQIEISTLDLNAFCPMICHRKFGIGADGVVFFSNNEKTFNLRFYNPDGSMSFCGNATRCSVLHAYKKGLFSLNQTISFTANNLPCQGILMSENIASIQMKNVEKITPFEHGDFVDTGSPHFVYHPRKNINSLDLKPLFAQQQPVFQNIGGVNINVVEKLDQKWQIRTFERGVNDETLSCGTGIVASAIALSKDKTNGDYTIELETKGGEASVAFTKNGDLFSNIWLQAPVEKVFSGQFNLK